MRDQGKASRKTTGEGLGGRANRFANPTRSVVVDYFENGFQYHFELAMFCPFHLRLGLQTFKQAEIRYGKVPPGRRNVVISVPHCRTSLDALAKAFSIRYGSAPKGIFGDSNQFSDS